jgi:chromosomal replication initiation ATPase DnaA
MNAAVLMGPSREGPIVRARHALVWIARNRLGASYPNIGRYLARDHTTILHGARRAEILRAADPAFAAIVARVEFELWPGASA